MSSDSPIFDFDKKTFGLVYDHMPTEVHVWETVRDDNEKIITWKLVHANPAALSAWNLSLSETIGKTPEEMFPGSNPTETFLPIVEKIFTTNKPLLWSESFEKTGQHLKMLSIPSGKYFISVGLDVSETIEKEILFRTIIDSIPDLFYLKNADGTYAACNKAAEKLIGLSENEQIGKTDFDLLPDGYAKEVQKDDLMVLETLEPLQKEEWIDISPNKSLCFSTIKSPVFDSHGKPTAIVGISRDITEKKRDEIFRNAKIQLMQIDSNRSVPEIHQKSLDIIQEVTESEIGFYHHYLASEKKIHKQAWSTNTHQFCDVNNIEVFSSLENAGVWADCIRKKQTIVHNDLALVPERKGLPEGHTEVLREVIVPIFSNGKIVAILGVGNKPTPYTEFDRNLIEELAEVSWNIASRKIYEDELIDAKSRADQSNKAKSTFLANMSHELRTPLNGILGMLQVLESTSLDNEQNECIALAKESGENLLSLLSDVLDLSSIEAGSLGLEKGVINTEDLISDLQSTFRSTLNNLPIDLSFEVDKDLAKSFESYPTRLKQILFNLIGNAIKYTPKGNVVCKFVQTKMNNKDAVQFIVTDSGIGISENNIQRIFQPFLQVEDSYKRQFQGAGLGLSIVQKLVRMLEGDIEIKSEEGVGTEISVTLPASFTSPKMTTGEQEPDLNTKDFAGLTVLVVEDNFVNLKTITMLLEKEGVAVRTAQNGKVALEILKDETYNLVIMDIEMPVMDGIEATKTIREGSIEGIDSKIPIIALTAYAMRGDAEKFIAAGMNYYLAKPIKVRSLRFILDKFGLKASS